MKIPRFRKFLLNNSLHKLSPNVARFIHMDSEKYTAAIWIIQAPYIHWILRRINESFKSSTTWKNGDALELPDHRVDSGFLKTHLILSGLSLKDQPFHQGA